MDDEVVVFVKKMGWEKIKGKNAFVATVVFSAPPPWPFKVVWERLPVLMKPAKAKR